MKVSLAVKIALTIAVMLLVVAVAVPWNKFFEKKLEDYLEARGFENAQLTVSSIGLGGIKISNVTVGGKSPLSLKDITVGYSLPALLGGSVNELALTGLTIEMRPAPSAKTEARSLPVTPEQLGDVPVKGIVLKDSHLLYTADKWKADVPLQLEWRKLPEPVFAYKAAGLHAGAQNIDMMTGDLIIDAGLKAQERAWKGNWTISDIKISGAGDVPVLNGSGTVAVMQDHVAVEGGFANADKNYRAIFRLEYWLNEPAKSVLAVNEASMPWSEGILSVKDVIVPFGDPKPYTVNVHVQHVSLDALMRQLTGERAKATGVISGVLPIAIAADGSIALQEGKLLAEQPGTIAMSPDAIPGDNPQVALARDVLKNFQYTALSVGVDNNADKKLSILMNLEGRNPDVYNGRAVKLNVHLTGDVLDFIQQNVLMLSDPHRFLEQGSHE